MGRFNDAMVRELTVEIELHVHPALMPERRYSLPTLSICHEKQGQLCKRQTLAIVRQRWIRWWEGESYPAFVVRGRCTNSELVVRFQCRLKEKKGWRSKEGAKKGSTEKISFVARSGVWHPVGAVNHPALHLIIEALLRKMAQVVSTDVVYE
jgi:hypothetical protein